MVSDLFYVFSVYYSRVWQGQWGVGGGGGVSTHCGPFDPPPPAYKRTFIVANQIHNDPESYFIRPQPKVSILTKEKSVI